MLTTGEHDWFEDMIINEAKKLISSDELPAAVGHLAAPITASAVNNANESICTKFKTFDPKSFIDSD